MVLYLTLAPKSSATAFQLMVSKSEVRSQLVGQWEMHTKVIWSDCDYVPEGSETKSEISILDINGKLFPEWNANEWQLVRNSAIDFHYNDSLHWERESKLEQDGDYWFVRTINDFNFDQEGKLIAKGVVKQYLNGEFVGTYVTESTLIKNQSTKLVLNK